MEIMEIIKDAAMYPINNVKALVIYVALMIVAVLALIFTGVGFIGASEASGAAAGGLGILGIIGIIIALAIVILIAGYMLDVIKIAVNREDGAPEIDPQRQIINGLKYLIMVIVYMIIPVIIMNILLAINDTFGIIVGVILMIIFIFGLNMGVCRLAKTESLGYALNIKEAFNDILKVGIVKLLAVLILVAIIGGILNLIASAFTNFGDIGIFISAILTAIVSAYVFFFNNRALGLLYSDVE